MVVSAAAAAVVVVEEATTVAVVVVVKVMVVVVVVVVVAEERIVQQWDEIIKISCCGAPREGAAANRLMEFRVRSWRRARREIVAVVEDAGRYRHTCIGMYVRRARSRGANEKLVFVKGE